MVRILHSVQKFFFKLKRKISLYDIFYMMKKQPASQPSSVPNSLHRSRMERLTQKSTTYKVPAAEAAGQKQVCETFSLNVENSPPPHTVVFRVGVI